MQLKKILLPITILACMILSPSIYAQSLDINVSNQIRLTSSLDGSSYSWIVVGPDGPVNHITEQNGKTLVFIPPKNDGTYVAFLTVLRDGKLISISKYVLTNPTPGPTPNPNPTPNPPTPGPDPKPIVLPEGKYGLAQKTFDLVSQLDRKELDRMVSVVMPDGNTVQISVIRGLANNYFEVMQRIKDEEFSDPQDPINLLSQLNHAVLDQGQGAGNIPGTVLKPLGQTANDLWLSGKIANLEDWAVAFEEMYNGFNEHINK